MNANKFAIFAIALFTQAAWADSSTPWYAGIAAGNNKVEGMDWSRTSYINGNPTGVSRAHIDMESHPSLLGTLGYRLTEHIAIEAEFAHRKNSTEQMVLSTGFALAGHSANLQSDSMMLSAKYKFVAAGTIQPFLGRGIGAARLNLGIQDNHGRSANSAWVAAYQALAGVEIKIDRHWSLTGVYQYFKASNPDIDVVRPQTATSSNTWRMSDYAAQTFSIGVQFNF